MDRRHFAALIVETGRRAPRDDHDGRGIYVSALQAPLLDGFLRLVRLLDTPDDDSVLAPAVSPVQYQKRLRLQEARRLLLSEATSAESVAYQVGYASPSQFNREYVRLFGQPPRRDAERLRAEAGGGPAPNPE